MVICDGTGRKIGFLEKVYRTPDGKVYCEEYVQQMKEDKQTKEDDASAVKIPESSTVELTKSSQWEFQVLKLTPPKDRSQVSVEKIEEVINNQGEQGWELVTVVPISLLLMQQSNNNIPALVFKRPKKKSSNTFGDSVVTFA